MEEEADCRTRLKKFADLVTSTERFPQSNFCDTLFPNVRFLRFFPIANIKGWNKIPRNILDVIIGYSKEDAVVSVDIGPITFAVGS